MGLLDSLKKIFIEKEGKVEPNIKKTVSDITYEIDEEDRIVVALAVSAMAAEEKSNSEFRITKITRIK